MNTKNRIAVSDLNAKSDIRGGATKTSTPTTTPATPKQKSKKDKVGLGQPTLPPSGDLAGRETNPV